MDLERVYRVEHYNGMDANLSASQMADEICRRGAIYPCDAFLERFVFFTYVLKLVRRARYGFGAGQFSDVNAYMALFAHKHLLLAAGARILAYFYGTGLNEEMICNENTDFDALPLGICATCLATINAIRAQVAATALPAAVGRAAALLWVRHYRIASSIKDWTAMHIEALRHPMRFRLRLDPAQVHSVWSLLNVEVWHTQPMRERPPRQRVISYYLDLVPVPLRLTAAALFTIYKDWQYSMPKDAMDTRITTGLPLGYYVQAASLLQVPPDLVQAAARMWQTEHGARAAAAAYAAAWRQEGTAPQFAPASPALYASMYALPNHADFMRMMPAQL